MTIENQIRIAGDPLLTRFIREYPIWYKRLNRNPDLFKDMIRRVILLDLLLAYSYYYLVKD